MKGSNLVLAWFIVSMLSMFIYAFTGVGFWSPLQSGDITRAMLLFIFHFTGPFAYVLSRMP